MATTIAPPLLVEPPFIGLSFFTEQYADRFFGRAADSSVIVGNLCASRLTLLYAQSGVGKSSLLRAGVAARIHERGLSDMAAGRPPRFVAAVFSRWQVEDPIAGIVEKVSEALVPFQHDPTPLSGGLEQAFEDAHELVDTTVLVILDQFEEYFLYHADGSLADQLAACIKRPDLRVNFLISIREDMYAGLGDLFRGRIPNVYGNFLHLDYLDRNSARDAIVKPIALLRESHPEIDIEPELVEAVLDGVRLKRGPEDTVDESGPERIETAYLQLVMRRLWDAEQEAGSPLLRLETLKALGGTQEVIESHLNTAMADLESQDQDVAAAAFQFLVTRAGTKIAWTTKDLSEVAKLDEGQLGHVFRRLAEGDVKILRPIAARDGVDGASYEIFHDALARPIVRWREEHAVAREREAKEEAQRVAEAATARAARERTKRRLAIAGLCVAVVALIAVSGVFAYIESRNADHHQRVEQAVRVSERVRAATGFAFRADAVALAAIETQRLSPTFEARSAAVGALQENAGTPKILSGHWRSVVGVAFAGDGSGRLASASTDGTLRIWRSDGKPLQTMYVPCCLSYRSVAFDGGRLLATGISDGSVQLWSLDHGKYTHVRRLVWKGDESESCSAVPCSPVAFNPAGTLLVAGDREGTLRMWSTKDFARPLQVLPGKGEYSSLAFTPDGRTLIAAGGFGATVRDVSGERLSPARSTGLTSQVWSVSPGPDDTFAAATDKGVDIRRLTGDQLVRQFRTPHTIYGVAFVDGSQVAYGGTDGGITVRNLVTGMRVGPPRSHTEDVNGLAVSPDGRTIASVSDDAYVKLWRTDGSGALAWITHGRGISTRIAVGAGGEAAAGRLISDGVYVWTPAAVPGPTRERTVRLADDLAPLTIKNDILATKHGEGFRLWNVDRTCRKRLLQHCLLGSSPPVADTLEAIAFDRSGKHAATGTLEGTVTVWDVSKPSRIRVVASGRRGSASVNVVAFSPFDDDILATASDDGRVRIWRYDGRKLTVLSTMERTAEQEALAFSPTLSRGQKILAAGGLDQTITLWNVNDPTHPVTVPLPASRPNTVLSLAFSPDGSTLAAGDGDGNICLYDVDSLLTIGSSLCLSRENSGTVDSVAFDPTGRLLLSTGRGEPVIEWSSALWGKGSDADLTRTVCRLAPRSLKKAQWAYAFADTKLQRSRPEACTS